MLETNEEARELARQFVERRLIPQKAVEDAFHVAIATAQGMDFLLTWNCRHIANAEIIERLHSVCEELGYEMPHSLHPRAVDGKLKACRIKS